MAKDEPDASLRELHLYTHPALLYGVISNRQPRLLRRGLSYAARTGKVRGAQTSGSALHVRLGALDLSGHDTPAEVTVLVALCEAASTGQDFKPVRAAAISLASLSSSSSGALLSPGCLTGLQHQNQQNQYTQHEQPQAWQQQQPHATGSPAAEEGLSSGGLTGSVVLPLPARRLTRPTLLLLVSDCHPDLTALVPPSGGARLLRTDLHPGSPLLGLLPDPGPVWAAVHPLGELLPAGTSGGGGGGQGATCTPTPAQQQQQHQRLQLRLGRLALSRCSVNAAGGRTLVAMLLNLSLGPGSGKPDAGLRLQTGGGAGVGTDAVAASAAEDGVECPGVGGPAATEAAASRQGSKGGGAKAGRGHGSGGNAAHGADASDGAVAAAEVAKADPNALLMSRPAVQFIQLESLAVAMALEVKDCAAAAAVAAVSVQRRLYGTVAGADLQQHQHHQHQEERGVVEFRYMLDSGCAKQRGHQAAARQGEVKERRRGGRQPGGGSSSAMAAAAGGAGAARMPAPPIAVAAAAAAGLGAALAGRRGCGGRAAWMQQQISKALQAAEAAAADADKECCFVEETRALPGGLFSCPMCPAACRGVQGLRQHLTASHGLYSYTFLTDPRVGGTDAAVPVGRHLPHAEPVAEQALLPRHVLEVRLPGSSVAPSGCDLLLRPSEDVVLLPPARRGAPPTLMARSWVFSRTAGLTRCVFTDELASGEASD
ncbi:hypothetical protein Agub_g10931, partial [Astrephomene gubernaculifera]